MPEISILIAARNEEANLLRCLQSVARLTPPTDGFEVLIGNDRSDDQTGPIARAFIADKPQFRCIDVTETMGHQAGKANVLAHLARLARGRYLLFTDADCEVPPTWLAEMTEPFADPNLGVVVGTTQMTAHNGMQRLQALDWFFGQFLIHQFARLNIPVTAMGNNLAVRRVAYDAVGGYENLPFSLVEDYQLFTEIVQRRYGFAHCFDRRTLVTTQPLTSWSAWLAQRKRWMVGGLKLPLYFFLLLALVVGYYPALIGLAFWSPALAATIWGVKFVIQTVQLLLLLHRMKRWDLLPQVAAYDPYVHLGYLAMVIYYFMPTKVVWKGRVYNEVN